MAELRTQEGASDTSIWEYLVNLVKTLSEQGMSSEESEDEMNQMIEPAYRPRRLPWRWDIKDKLVILDDQQHLDQDVFKKSGAKPVTRLWCHRNMHTNRPHVSGLPRSFYKRSRLDKQTECFVERTLQPSEKLFHWMHNNSLVSRR